MFSAVRMVEPFTALMPASVLLNAGRTVLEKESGWNTFLIQSQL